jgi:hypothetical protein
MQPRPLLLRCHAECAGLQKQDMKRHVLFVQNRKSFTALKQQ